MLPLSNMSELAADQVSVERYNVEEENLSSEYINNEVLADFNLDEPDIEALGRVIRGNEAIEELESELAELRDSQVERFKYKGPGGPFRTSMVSYPVSNTQIASGVAIGDVSISQGASDIWNSTVLSQEDENYPATRVAITERDDGSPLYGDLVQAHVNLHPSDNGEDIEQTIDNVLGGSADDFFEHQEEAFGVKHKRVPRHFEMEASKN